MSLGPFNAVQQPTRHPLRQPLPAYKLRQLGLFWLSFCSGLVLLAFLLIRPQAGSTSASSPQRPTGKGNRGVLFDVNLGDTPTAPPLPTIEPTTPSGEGTVNPTTPPTDTPEPPKSTVTPPEPPPTPLPTNTPVPVTPDTPVPPPTIIPTSTPLPPATTPPEPTVTTAATARPTNTSTPVPSKPSDTPTLIPTTATKPTLTATLVADPATPKPNPKPTTPPEPTQAPTALPTTTSVPAPTATATRRRPTNTPTVIVQPSPTANATATRQSEINATATTTAEQVVVPPVAEATATPAPTPTSALTQFIADNSTGPILIYTYTQRLKPDGNHLVAACVLNIGDAPASNVETAFDAKSPAVITGLRIPSELSSRGAKRATVRIATLSPKFMKQLEVSVGNVDIPVPEWISVTITRAYALNHPGDPAFPEKCEPEGIDAVTSDVKEVTLSVGPYRQILEQGKQAANANRNLIVLSNSDLGPAISLSVLQCVVGWIAFCFVVLLLLVFIRRRRRQQLQTTTS